MTNHETIPEGLDLIASPTGTIIRRKWLTWVIAPLALFAIVWDGFLFFWYTQALKPGAPLMAILFPLGHVAVGVGITYFVLASLVNKTDIRLNSSFLEVSTGPLPWLGNKRIMADSITHIVVRERTANRGQTRYAVMYAGLDRKEKKFVTGISNEEQADFIAARVREAIQLKN